MLTDEDIKSIRYRLQNLTDEESNAIWEKMIRDGIIDREGKVLVRMPEGPPDWAKPANGHATTTEPKKPKRPRSKK